MLSASVMGVYCFWSVDFALVSFSTLFVSEILVEFSGLSYCSVINVRVWIGSVSGSVMSNLERYPFYG